MTRQISLITGSTRGIGKQIGIDLLNRGHFVIFTGNNISSIELLRKELEGRYNIGIYKVDFSNEYSIEEFCDEISKDFKKIDNIICNVATTCRKPFNAIDIKEWNNIMNFNLTYPIFTIKKLSEMITRRIIFIGSVLGRIPDATSIPYGISKGTLEILTKYLAKEFANRNITVNTIALGFTNTEWHKDKSIEQIQRITEKILLKRFAEKSEISHACQFLIDNNYITGQTLNIDGGYGL